MMALRPLRGGRQVSVKGDMRCVFLASLCVGCDVCVFTITVFHLFWRKYETGQEVSSMESFLAAMGSVTNSRIGGRAGFDASLFASMHAVLCRRLAVMWKLRFWL
jgi:hypothetical protein